MKKTNFTTFIILCLTIIGTILFSFIPKKHALSDENNAYELSSQTALPILEDEPFPSKDTYAENETEKSEEKEITPANLSNALFIGDSRTVGIMEYANLSEADFFCNTGMSVFNIYKERISLSTVGKVTLTELLSNKTYDTIYLMLGINELGYPFQSIVDNYKEVYDFIRNCQPDAIIFIQANMHVTKERSDSDTYFNNTAINRLNTELSKLADNPNTFYIDVNPLFDDENGNLSTDKSADTAHLYAKYYATWGDWIRMETAKLLY